MGEVEDSIEYKKGEMPDGNSVYQLYAQKTRNLDDVTDEKAVKDYYASPYDSKKIEDLTNGAKEDAKKSIQKKGNLTGLAADIDEEEDYYDRKARVLDDLMAPQNEKLDRVHEMLQGKASTGNGVDYEGFKNKDGKNVIFTQEQIDEMDERNPTGTKLPM